MLRSLWFLFHICVFALLLVFANQNPGTLKIEWLGRAIDIQIGLALCLAYVLVLASFFTQKIFSLIAGIPRSMARKQRDRKKQDYWHITTQGLTALAAGDTKSARRLSDKAAQIAHDTQLAHPSALFTLLQAQTARLEGNEGEATRLFEQLSTDKHAGFLGTRALLQNALSEGNTQKAAQITQDSLKTQKNNPWLRQAAYKTAIESRDWGQALDHLKLLDKRKILDKDTVASDRLALLIALYDDLQSSEKSKDKLRSKAIKTLKRAYKLSQDFPPLIQRLAKYNTDNGRLRRAQGLVRKAWASAPHPELATLWESLAPKPKRGDFAHLHKVQWMEKLVDIAPNHFESHYALATAAFDAKLWGEARGHFMTARDLLPQQDEHHQQDKQLSTRWYIALAQLERAQSEDEDAAQQWLSEASTAPADKGWICTQTGTPYPVWSPLAAPHNSFNTIKWQAAQNQHDLALLNATHSIAGLIE